MRNRIALQTVISDCSETAVHSHPFSNISPENTGGRVLVLDKLYAKSLIPSRCLYYKELCIFIQAIPLRLI